jgi:phosphatidylinositol dimannoside acyltransferase
LNGAPPANPSATLRVLRGKAIDTCFELGWGLAGRVPVRTLSWTLDEAADLVWARRGPGVRQLEANLHRAVTRADQNELRRLSRRAMRSYFRYWREAFELPSWSTGRIVDSVVTVNEAPLRAAMSAGRGAIVALPHMANWDHAGAWACLTGMPVTTVAEVLQPQSLFDRFVGYREALGMQVLPLTPGAGGLAGLRNGLADNRLVCLVADRDLTRAGVEVELLGAPAALPPGPAALARVTRAPLFAAVLSYDGALLRIEFSDPVPSRSGPGGVVAMTQVVADVFSAGIRRTPTDWHMLQPVFSADTRADQLRASV